MYYSKRIVCCLFLTTTLSLLQITNQETAEQQQQQHVSVSASNCCFRQYLVRNTNATSTYATNCEKCIEIGTQMRWMYTLEKQSDRENVLRAGAAICTRLHNCNEVESDMDFFQCILENGLANIANLIVIKLISSEALIDLEDKYDAVEKQVQLCFIQQEKLYLQDVTATHEELQLCLKVVKD